MIERIAQFATRHAMFRPGDRVGVAVSGGADSVFLLHALRDLASRWDLKLSVVHVEHGIRGVASLADAEFVRGLAEATELPFHLLEVNVPASDDNLEQAARRARHEFFQELIASGQIDRIATGHTRSDQGETVLYRIVRGSGLAGLAGILPVTDEGLVRPVLELTRREIEQWLKDRAIAWREDETNQDCAYARNRLRHDVFPLLREYLNPRVDEALANLAALAQDEEAYWDAQMAQRLPGPATEPLILNVRELVDEPHALARRLLRRAIELTKGDLRQIEFPHIERILEMVHSDEGHDRVQIPGVDIFRSFEWLRFARLRTGPPLDRDFESPVEAPGLVELARTGTRITLQVQEKDPLAQPYATVEDELDWLRFSACGSSRPSLEVRNWRPGDQYRRVGQSREQKIKFLFQEARIPLWERRNWPIITYKGTIVWARRFGAAAEFAAGPEARIVLKVAEARM